MKNTPDYIISFLRKSFPQLEAVYLYGSRADGTEKPDSDYDLALLLPYKSDSSQLYFLAQELAAAIHCDVDLIDLNQAPLILQFQVVAHGKAVFISEPFNIYTYEMKILSMYQRFNDERKEILQEISASGQILS
jgi:predicted nucleotidyltransferase